MPPNNSSAQTEDLRAHLDRALEAEKGIRILIGDKSAATHLRHRFYSFRTADRKSSLDIFPEGDARRGKSVYDGLVVNITKDDNIEIRKLANDFQVEEL